MGIFGTTAPKFVYDDGGTYSHTVTLPYANVTRNEAVTDYVEHKSEIDGDRDFIPRGKHRVVEMQYNLFKHGTAAARKYNDIMEYVGRKVSLWLHADGDKFVQSSGAAALFCLKEVSAYNIETATYRDGLTLLFESTDPVQVDLTDQDVTVNYRWSNDHYTFTDWATVKFSDSPVQD